MLHQLPEQQELQAGQRDRALPDVGFQPAEVKHQLSGPEHLAQQVAVVAQPDPDPGQQLGQRERLGQVVLGAQLQAVHLGRDVGQAGQHQHGLFRPVPAQPGEDLPAVHVRHHQVKDDEVVLLDGGPPEPVFAVAREIDCIAGCRQSAGNELADLRLVVHDEDPCRSGAWPGRVDRLRR